MSDAIERYQGLGSKEETGDLSGLFDDEESGETGENKTELTPERVARVWDKLSDIEKKFVTTTDEQFAAIIPGYEEKYGEKKAGVIKALRKLILSGDPRAGLIQAEASL
ncbi:MAG: hypothetical protein WAP55_01410 [Minisyncoccia bacterium]